MTWPQITRALVELARRQGSVVTWDDAMGCGASNRLMAHLVKTGVFRRELRGVYVLAGVPMGHDTRLRCALVAFGAGLVASHRSAAWLQELVDQPPRVPEVTALGRTRAKFAGVRFHSSSVPIPSHRYKGIPCTIPVRTLVDLAVEVPVRVLDEAIDRALARGLVRLGDLWAASGTRRRGQGRLRSAVERRGLAGGPSPSVLESHMSRVFESHGLPAPEAEVVAGPDDRYRVDYAYEEVRLAIEGYGYAWHHTPEQLSYDLGRQAKLVAEGWTVLAYTWKQILEEPDRIADEIATTYDRLLLSQDVSRPVLRGP